jgi:SAM-dependent methyltransferase
VLSYYQNNYFDEHADDQSKEERLSLNEHILSLIEAHASAGRLLDVGCGRGFFLKAARCRGWQVQGIDPSERSIRDARTFVGNDVSVGTLRDLSGSGCFDVVTMINVLDHLRDPWTDLRRCRDLLRPGGCLYLRFPNGLFHRSLIRLQTRITRRPMINALLVFHEYAFTPAFIQRLLRDQGYTAVTLHNARISGAALDQHTTMLRFISRGVNGLVGLLISLAEANRRFVGPSLEVLAKK